MQKPTIKYLRQESGRTPKYLQAWPLQVGTRRNMRKRKGRTVGIVIGAVVLLSLAAAIIVPHFIDINKYHNQIHSQLEKRLGRRVSLSNMGLSLLPPSFRVENAVIAEDPRFNTGSPFATAEKLTISVRFWPLLRKVVEIKSLELDRPRIELVKDTQGVWNFDTLGQERKSASLQNSLVLEHLLITDGQVAITDQQQSRPRSVYDHIDLDVRDFSSDKQFSMKVSALLPGTVKQAILLEGTAGPIQADALKTPFDGRLHLDQVPTSAAAIFLNSQAFSGIEAVVSGEARVRNSGGKLDSSGTIRLDDAHVHNVNVGYPITLDYDVSDDTGTEMIQIRKGDVRLGSTPVNLAGWLNTKSTPAQIDVKLTAANASIGEAARLASAFGVVFGQGTDVTGQVNVNVQARGSANRPILNGQVSARNLVISGKDLPQPVKVGAIELTLTSEAIRSNDFVATTGSSSVSGNFALSQYSTPNGSINTSLRAANARLGDILNIAKAAGISAADGVSGDGTLGFDVHVQGPTRDLAALSFTGKGKIQNTTLKTPSLTQSIQLHNSDLTFSQKSASLQNISATVGPTNVSGVLTIKDFATQQLQFTLKADKIDVSQMEQLFAAAPSARARDDIDSFHLVSRAEAAVPAEPSLLHRMTGGGTITIGVIQYDDLVLNNVRSSVAVNRGLISMSPITADVYGGKESGTIAVDMRPAQPVYSVNLKTDKVDANKLVSSVSSLKQILYGLLAANVNGTFSSTSADAIARSMNGDMELNLTNGKLMNLDLLRELSAVGKFMGSLPDKPKNFTNLVQLSGNFKVRDGVARTSNLKAVIDGGTIAANGLVNLADQSLNLHVTAVLNKALSQQVGGSQIGGFMNTALANGQNELVLPIILTGTFQHPQIGPDLQLIAEMKLQNLLPTASNPAEFTSSLLGAIVGSKNKSQQQGTPAVGNHQGQQEQNPLGEVLDQVLRKKKKRPAPSATPTPNK
jgi:uncharacterized protein involved in outer membrane biogenesis